MLICVENVYKVDGGKHFSAVKMLSHRSYRSSLKSVTTHVLYRLSGSDDVIL